ncbi:MlaE family lipid ABC transporter permease subunit [Methylocella sp. CPCC 101449]|jgi:phospholipid/cholesterol/gamma-HCH transport system permease protein|uniref:ABC transporter permease n=1 Tax=Methylocella sp. CPCC 101449 TaxID=2987531 RepID=UPI00288D4E8F|nr:MlaE family lipid ABC transporter permease subunit [Methylocella sp. CPCC 101449]MDT2021046.1 MlaE family lipid ABC transporter permease subunit [Methylocella sp. CPCC 101449]HEV2570697.1 MlaE family lipid ABC transporter permease subunit [Beijerinckiaceae bacterium]
MSSAATDKDAQAPQIDERDGARIALSGPWTVEHGAEMEAAVAQIGRKASGDAAVTIDLSGVERLDTAGAWLIDSARQQLDAKGVKATFAGAKHEQEILLKEAHYRTFDEGKPGSAHAVVDLLVDIGKSVVGALKDFYAGFAFLGEVVSALLRSLTHPRRLRFTSIVYHMENFALRALPIILLINFLVGCIVAQQGIFQFTKFGATAFVVDLIGVLVLRELAVLLTSIMMAGRTGSAITAEIGSMKMREEIDALKVMGLDPIEVLVLPRLIALIIALPLLTFLADLSAIFGGMLIAWGYGDLSPEIFTARLREAIGMNTFLVGLIKAPFMALMIGMIAVIEGFAVQGSAESLGRQVTGSVVKSIFMVIFVDGLFAMFFAAIRY